VAANSPKHLPLAESDAANGTIKSAAADNSAEDLPSHHEIEAESSATSGTSVSKSSVAIKKKVTFMDVDAAEQHPGDNEAEHTSSNATAQSETLAAAAAEAAAELPSAEAAASSPTSQTRPTQQTRPGSGNHDDDAHAARAAPAGDRVAVDAAHDAAVDDKDAGAAASHTQPSDGAEDVGCAHNLKRLIEMFGEQLRGKIRGDCGVDDGGDECVTRLVRWLLHTLVGSSSGSGNRDNTVTPRSNIGGCHDDANADQTAAVSVECDSGAVSDVRGNVAAPAKTAASTESPGTEVTVATTPVVTFELRGYCSFVPIGLQFCWLYHFEAIVPAVILILPLL
jgi:hypothetical protein